MNNTADCGHSNVDAFVRTYDGETLCYDCAAVREALEMSTSDSYSGYLSMERTEDDGLRYAFTTWPGYVLGKVIWYSAKYHRTPTGGYYERWHVTVQANDGTLWYGQGSGPGMYVSIKRYKKQPV